MRRTFHLVVASLLAVAPAVAQTASDGYLSTADGARIHYRLVGAGPDTVIVLHGGPGFDLNYLEPDFAPLAKRHALVFYDQRGTGLSTVIKDTTQLTAARFVADLDELRATLKIDRAILLGHSWGGGLAALYAFDHPQHVARLILADALPARRAPWLEVFSGTLVSRRDSATRARLKAASSRRSAANDAEYVSACRDYNAVFALTYLADPASVAKIRGDFCAAPIPALRNLSVVNASVLGSLGAWDFRPRISTLTAPLLVVHGEFDPLSVASAAEWAAAPNARLALVPMAGHFAYAERPDVFFPIVEAFLAGGWPAGSVHP